MIPQLFDAKWRIITLKEKSAAQEHFVDLCYLVVGHPTPAEADPGGKGSLTSALLDGQGARPIG